MPTFNQAEFKEALDTSFHLTLDTGEKTGLVLKEVSDVKQNGPFESFSIELHGPKEILLEQRIYELTNDKLGTKSVFLVPVGEDENVREYQAVFNYKKE